MSPMLRYWQQQRGLAQPPADPASDGGADAGSVHSGGPYALRALKDRTDAVVDPSCASQSGCSGPPPASDELVEVDGVERLDEMEAQLGSWGMGMLGGGVPRLCRQL